MATSTATVLIPGTVVHQRYVIQEVRQYHDQYRRYLALDSADRFCLLTEFPLHSNNSAIRLKLQQLFKQKTAPLLALSHPQLPRFTAAFQEQEGFFLVQVPTQGIPYRQLLKLLGKQGRSMTEPEVIHLLTHLLPALHELHARKLIHCKISPDSIVLPVPQPKSADALRAALRHEVPMLVELGAVDSLARQLAALQTHPSGSMMSNMAPSDMAPIARLGYAPPEQVQTGRIYAHSDLYGLAVTCLELLTGQPPQKLLDSHTLTWSWQPYTSLSPSFEAILAQMLSWQPGDRYATASEVLKLLKTMQSAFDIGFGRTGASRSKASLAELSAGSILSMESWTIDSFRGARRRRTQESAGSRREDRLRRNAPLRQSQRRSSNQTRPAVALQTDTSGLATSTLAASDPSQSAVITAQPNSAQLNSAVTARRILESQSSFGQDPSDSRSPVPQWQAWLLLTLLSGGMFASALLMAPSSRSQLSAAFPQAKSPLQLATWIQTKLSRSPFQTPTQPFGSTTTGTEALNRSTPEPPRSNSALNSSELQAAELLNSDIPIPLYLSANRPEQSLEGSLLILPSQTYFLIGQAGQRLVAHLEGEEGMELSVLNSELRPLEGDSSSATTWEGELVSGDRTLLRITGEGRYQLQLTLESLGN